MAESMCDSPLIRGPGTEIKVVSAKAISEMKKVVGCCCVEPEKKAGQN